jgi:hypothetical protein
MGRRQREALTVLFHERKLVSKQWDLWAGLSRRGLVEIKSKPPSLYGVEAVRLTVFGEVVAQMLEGE